MLKARTWEEISRGRFSNFMARELGHEAGVLEKIMAGLTLDHKKNFLNQIHGSIAQLKSKIQN
jgi:hypothetical protein